MCISFSMNYLFNISPQILWNCQSFLYQFPRFLIFSFLCFNQHNQLLSQTEVAYIFPSLALVFAYGFQLYRSVFVFIFNNVFTPYECFLFCLLYFVLKPERPYPLQGCKGISPMCCFSTFIVLLFTFSPWIHLEFSVVQGMIYGHNITSFPDGYPCPSAST